MAYSKQNFQNGQILNAANLEAMENGIIAGQGAHNLLDNSDFRNPVNQMGSTTATLGKYFIDRWGTEPFPSGPSITIDSNGLTLLPTTSSTAGIYQMLPDYENRKGKVHTFAICVDNVWKCVSFTMGNFGVGYLIHGLYFFSVDNRNILIRNNASDTPVPITIQRVALYEGSYTADTLPSYVPKGKRVEMLNCGVPLQPRNLLDNSDFRNPVNQRGKTSYGGGEYAIDRWKTQSGTNINIMDGFIRITGDWDAQQILGNKLIGTYTYAIYAKVNVAGEYTQTIEIYENGSSIAASFCTAVGEWKIFTCTATFTGGTNPVVTINNRAGSVSDASIDVKWAALYEGSYDASTLPAYQPKGYAAELAECQRYYQIIPFDFSMYNVAVDSSYPSRYQITLPQTMRITPTVTLNPSWGANIKTAETGYISKKGLTFNVSGNDSGYTEWHGSITLSADL